MKIKFDHDTLHNNSSYREFQKRPNTGSSGQRLRRSAQAWFARNGA
jgi:hypothetical protein